MIRLLMVRRLTLPALLSLSALLAPLLSGCTNAGDNGRPCFLVKRDPADTDPSDGVDRVRITEGEIGQGTDFISFSATECEDLVCVREAGTETTGNPAAEAVGKCSRPCAGEGAECPSAVENLTLSCRALLLDTDTLSKVRQADPDRFENAFGGTTSPFFCVADRVAQAQ
jgi:hypothetical protein